MKKSISLVDAELYSLKLVSCLYRRFLWEEVTEVRIYLGIFYTHIKFATLDQ